MLLKITHETDLSYSELISESVMELRMAPSQEYDQHRLSLVLAIGPPAPVHSYFDWLGNTVHFFTVNAPHREIRIVATSVLEVHRVAPDLNSLGDRWPLDGESDYALYDFLHFGGPIIDSPHLRALSDQLRPQSGEPLAALALRLMALLNERFEYRPGVTTSASPVTEMLQHGRGVCQDFTHLMIALSRAMGIPTRYVSGLFHPDDEHTRGHTQSHAWCEWLFPVAGWIGFDPANNCTIGPNYIKVAIGRDYRDVPPNKGVYKGNATETIHARVHTEELSSIPPELAAERIRSLPVPVYSATASSTQTGVHQQQQQQQQ